MAERSGGQPQSGDRKNSRPPAQPSKARSISRACRTLHNGQNHKCSYFMRDAGCGRRDAGYGVRVAGGGMREAGFAQGCARGCRIAVRWGWGFRPEGARLDSPGRRPGKDMEKKSQPQRGVTHWFSQGCALSCRVTARWAWGAGCVRRGTGRSARPTSIPIPINGGAVVGTFRNSTAERLQRLAGGKRSATSG